MLKLCIFILAYSIVYAAKLCPDGNNCPDGSTCCYMGKEYGCCPMVRAVCCKDYRHCCPHGYQCDLTTATCFHGSSKDGVTNLVGVVPQVPVSKIQAPIKTVEKTLTMQQALSKVGNIICPDRYSICPTGYTCCMLLSGRYGCCQYNNAVCCNDHIHCCPKNYVCNIPYCAPKQQYEVLPMKKVERFTGMKMTYVLDNKPPVQESVSTCPDGKSHCSIDQKCCRTSDGDSYGCCSHKNGVCCSGGMYCCPEGFTCGDLTEKKCTKKLENIPMAAKVKAKFIEYVTVPRSVKQVMKKKRVNLIQCPVPDEIHYCPDTSTCCADLSGTYSCCPLKNAVCCASKTFCCPQGSCCGVHGCGVCNSNNTVTETVAGRKKVPMKKYQTCPDKKHACPFGTNCCPSTAGVYKCCPSGSRCKGGRCIRGHDGFTFVKHINAYRVIKVIKERSKKLSKQTCADNKTVCDDNNTCCNNIGAHYLCCPFTDAVCCKNSSHCCPKGYTCGPVGQGICNKDPGPGPGHHGDHGHIKKKLADISCPDNISSCADNSTCCILKSGTYGCCPIAKAICCSDQKHCCPPGYKCHTSKGGYCFKGDKKVLAFKYTKQAKKHEKGVLCKGGIRYCSVNSTCCKRPDGSHTCCQHPNASCCADGVGCCPHGYTCSGDLCIKNKETLAVTKYDGEVNYPHYITCPDGKSKCKYGSTCCPNNYNGYGCCPHLEAVCCKDKKHCCPNKFICNPDGYCSRGPIRMLASPHLPTLQLRGALAQIMCPDEVSKCFLGETCCRLFNGTYGCCPLENAVCCKDEEHCCPHGYRCFLEYCSRGGETIPALKRRPALDVEVQVQCDDKITKCPSGTTCCKLSSGHYACCPIPNAVCCSDMLHCCPQGYKCSGDYCIRGSERLLASTHTRPVEKHFVVKCSDGVHSCPDGNTCCKAKTAAGYGCCPLLNAVCCADKVHCCQSGYTCEVGGFCTRGSERLLASKHTQSLQKYSVIQCPDGISSCPDGNTCCKMSQGYGCCPVPNAVCCADMVHCCPAGFKCEAQGFCTRGSERLLASKHTQSLHKYSVIQCPDGRSSCPDGNTCCKMSQGYGCCPVPNAVCCADMVHCCPAGFKCEFQGFCTRGNERVPALTHVTATSIQARIFCPDKLSQCNADETCCILSTGGYGCCPLPSAVCCADKIHCCPTHYNCSDGYCISGESKIVAYKHTNALIVAPSSNLICPDKQTVCDTGTCCRADGDNYICCPLKDAVCCDDDIHCCPTNFKCVEGGKCMKADMLIKASNRYESFTFHTIKSKNKQYHRNPAPTYEQFRITPQEEKSLSRRDKLLLNILKHKKQTCHDGVQKCEHYETCCSTNQGSICCPLYEAVCCEDRCCPHGSSCTKEGNCEMYPVTNRNYIKFEASLEESIVDDETL